MIDGITFSDHPVKIDIRTYDIWKIPTGQGMTM